MTFRAIRFPTSERPACLAYGPARRADTNHQPCQCILRRMHASSLKSRIWHSTSGIGKNLNPDIDNTDNNRNQQDRIKMQCDFSIFSRLRFVSAGRGILCRPSSQVFPPTPNACIEWPIRMACVRYRSGIRAIANVRYGGCTPRAADQITGQCRGAGRRGRLGEGDTRPHRGVIARAQKKAPAARSGRESQSRRCHTNYGFRLRKSPAPGNESISISI